MSLFYFLQLHQKQWLGKKAIPNCSLHTYAAILENVNITYNHAPISKKMKNMSGFNKDLQVPKNTYISMINKFYARHAHQTKDFLSTSNIKKLIED